MSSSPCQAPKYTAAWTAAAFPFWAAYLALFCSTRACLSDGWLSAHTLLTLLGWTTLPAAASHSSLVLRRPDALSVPVSPSLYSTRRFHPAFVFLTGSCDRRQLMSTKARETKGSKRAMAMVWLNCFFHPHRGMCKNVGQHAPCARLRARPAGTGTSGQILLHRNEMKPQKEAERQPSASSRANHCGNKHARMYTQRGRNDPPAPMTSVRRMCFLEK